MSVNRYRGEIEAVLDGKACRLCLTLGALAELESAFGVDNISALLEKVSGGRLSAMDIARILGAGLRAGGTAVSDEDVLAMRADGGAAGLARMAADLLTASFGAPAPDP